MTEIPFIDRLGHAFEAAIAEPRPHRSRFAPRISFQSRRKALVLVVAGAAALVAAALAIAHVLASPDELAANSVACYTAADLSSDVTVVPNHGAPVAACAAAYRKMGQAAPPLVACANGTAVAVIPGADAASCERAGLQPLPAGFAASQANVARLARAVLTLEGQQDCVKPEELARGVERLLTAQGWVGWTAQLQRPTQGPCGTVSSFNGDGQRRIGGALDPSRRVVLVSSGPARSTTTLLYGRDGLAVSLEDTSGQRCYTVAGLTALVEARAAAAGRAGTVQVAAALPATTTLADARQARYTAGCAVILDVHAASDGRGVVAVIPNPATH